MLIMLHNVHISANRYKFRYFFSYCKTNLVVSFWFLFFRNQKQSKSFVDTLIFSNFPA